ncbi:MAG: hypothetical protein ACK54W_05745, partial [Alphaproteobacteria bacterium]
MRTRYRIERRALLTGGTALVLSAVAGARVPLAQTLEKLSFQTNWRAQAEHGGYYLALANGLYRRAGGRGLRRHRCIHLTDSDGEYRAATRHAALRHCALAK